MRGMLGLAVALILLGAAPLSAQAGRPISPVRAVGVATAPARPVAYVRPAPAARAPAAPVRIVTLAPATGGTNTTATSAVSTLPLSTPVLTSPGGAPIPLGQLLNPAPGLGFDFTHLAAINSNLAERAIVDPLTQQELALTEQLPREAPAAFFPDYGYGIAPVATGAPAQPQIIVLQQPAQPAAPAPVEATPSPAPHASVPPAPPLPPLGNLLLVERGGKVIQATAFTQQGNQVVYITPDGRRKTIAISRLDLKATEDRNAEHGTFLHLTG